jgi:rhamnulokinase
MYYLAFDLGASSGRAILGRFENRQLSLEEIYRFPNEPVVVAGSMHWDILRLFHEMKHGLQLAAKRYGKAIKSMAIDTWGVDYGLLGENDFLLGNPYHYRDHRTDGIMEETFNVLPRQVIFEKTGIQFMPINTLYQLFAFKKAYPELLSQVRSLLMIPDLFNFFFTGKKIGEVTIASTSQIYNPQTGTWDNELLQALAIPLSIFPELMPSGTVLGGLLPQVAAEVGMTDLHVIAPGSHDTASAIAAVPSEGEDTMYISSGTWMLAGVEVDAPVINVKTLRLNFTNEMGVCGKTRLLKNLMGLWLLQECRNHWLRNGESIDFETMTSLAAEAKPMRSLIDPDHPSFLNPENIPEAIQAYCRDTGQPVPKTKGEIIRCALESLALKVKKILGELEWILNKRLSVIHIVGGGVKNELLCSLIAEATGRKVITGPVEATAIGNILTQALAMGEIHSLAELKSIVRASTEVKVFEPTGTGWGLDIPLK